MKKGNPMGKYLSEILEAQILSMTCEDLGRIVSVAYDRGRSDASNSGKKFGEDTISPKAKLVSKFLGELVGEGSMGWGNNGNGKDNQLGEEP